MSNTNDSKIMVTIRIPISIKQQLVDLLPTMGLGLGSYFSMAAKQLIAQKRVPFEFKPVKKLRQSSKEKKVMTSFRIPADVKDKLTEILPTMGLTVSLYFVLAAEQLVIQKKVPFEFKALCSDDD
jgi:antitoxin component of RelBE/YafQ-DinJ toxin-antitoxin module